MEGGRENNMQHGLMLMRRPSQQQYPTKSTLPYLCRFCVPGKPGVHVYMWDCSGELCLPGAAPVLQSMRQADAAANLPHAHRCMETSRCW
jgi:hypothetical protein